MYIFFDLDGTLIDSIPDINRAINKALKKYNLNTISLEETKNYLGHGSLNLIKMASKGNFSNELYNDYKKFYHEEPCNLTKVYPYVTETLKSLKAKGHILGVYSNKDDSDVKKIVNYYFPNLFDYIFGKNVNYPLKPDKTFINEYLLNNKVNVSDFVYVGDMQTDYDLAFNLKAKFVFCKYGYSPKNIETKYCINSFKELSEIFD